MSINTRQHDEQFHLQMIEDVLNKAVESLNAKSSNREEILVTRFEMAAYLKVSLPTLRSWELKGYLNPVRIGSRVYYKKSALFNINSPKQ